ncbi:hypothetical protein PIIN_04221 [Serendipita indica DSM 11827]|uniref:Uncharacterized protein n=1 Tax=Serendipita indica (strain DSM 11827) TaxID=1109443 RepID=G4TG10_SERID|nr:hypothetical protein PIIN_04221 [Serendipita indica DSM 11827]
MPKNKKSRVSRALRSWIKYITSRQVIPVVKGTIAYVLALALIFTRKYDDLSAFPITLTAMIIVTIAGGPGKTFGACLQGAALALAGVLLGSGFFAILAKLGRYPVAQGVVFAVMVYILSIIKTKGQKWFAFSLLAILMTFNGIYTSLLMNGAFSPTYLLEYLKAYCWGAAIVLAVNVLIFPMSSERELRKTMVTSLEHIATFAALIGKAYTLTGTPEDKAARDLLSQTIKADFTFLSQKIDETSVEVNWSRYSMQDYQLLTDRIRQLQRTLITAHISLLRFDDQDVEVFRDDILPPTKLAFTRLRRDIDLTIREIGSALGCGPMYIEATQTGYLECLDQQRAAAAAAAGGMQPLQRTISAKPTTEKRGDPENQDQESEGSELDGDDIAENLMNVTRRLQAEMGAETPFRTEETRPGTPSHMQSTATPTAIGSTAIGTAGTAQGHKGSPVSPKSSLPKTGNDSTTKHGKIGSNMPVKPKYGPHMIKQHFDEFEAAQKEVLVELLTSTDLGENPSLKLHEPGPSIGDLYGGDFLRGDVEEGDLPFLTPSKKVSAKTSKAETRPNTRPSSIHQIEQKSEEPVNDDEEINTDGDSSIGPSSQFLRNQTLVRVYSLLFAWDSFVETLGSMHHETTKKRSAHLHFHVYESLIRPGKKPMPDIGLSPEDKEEIEEESRELSIKEALALLENKPFTPVKKSPIQRIEEFNKWLKSDTSIFAAKSAAAASVFATLIFASTTRQWFISYGLTSGLLTCVVALAPTLGQSLLTFVLQVSGSGLGTLVGWAILEMFKGVGGYAYNPYGMCAIIAVFAIPLQYCIYERPQLFVLSLLALNSAAVIMVTEHVYANLYRRPFDTPALRAGKMMTALAAALGIVIAFQLFILRNPARRTLRKALGNLVYSNLAYNTILQAYVRAVLPADPKQRAKPVVLKRIERELKHREAKMQAQIIEVSPLMAFAAAEPSFSKPFRGDLAQQIVQANQVILDRLREGRTAISTEPFDPYIVEHMIAVLSPYRRRASRINKTWLYLCAMSLISKSPLPHDSVLVQPLLNQFVHDALALSSQLSRTEQGSRAIQSDSFTRYWFWIISVSGLPTQLKLIDSAIRELYGELEDDPRLG